MKKDKEKVLDEVWTQDHIKSFLNIEPPVGVDADFHCLSTAYKSMRIDDFKQFLEYFSAAGRSVNGKNKQQQTIADIIVQHQKSGDYLKAVQAYQ